MHKLLVGIDEPWDSDLRRWIGVVVEVDTGDVVEFDAALGVGRYNLVVLRIGCKSGELVLECPSFVADSVPLEIGLFLLLNRLPASDSVGRSFVLTGLLFFLVTFSISDWSVEPHTDVVTSMHLEERWLA